MSKKLDVSYPREYTLQGEKKTHWIRCGVAFQNEAHIDVILYVVPPATTQHDGSQGVRFQLREPLPPRDGEYGQRQGASRPIVEQRRGLGGRQGGSDDEPGF